MSAVGESSTLLSGKEGSQRLFELLATPQKLVVCVLLGVSLSVNIVCLVPSIPFLLIDADPPINLVIPSGAYGLGATLDLLRHHNLWALYVLIFLFSICFPVSKEPHLNMFLPLVYATPSQLQPHVPSSLELQALFIARLSCLGSRANSP